MACAAYRSGQELTDERYSKVHDYSRKADVAYAEVLVPEGAPAWMGDRAALWNGVEACEKRKDAQLAREFNFALPRELSLEDNILLAREFVLSTFVEAGMVADLCVHVDKGSDGEPHPHAHVMLTMREVLGDGFGPKVREWNDKALLLSWREEWAVCANKHLALHGHDRVIDHRSFVEQGIDLEPQHKIGASVARDRSARLADHHRIARENGEKLLGDPVIALEAMTRQQSTFTHQDIARFVNRHTVDPEQFSLVYDKVRLHESVVSLGIDDRGVDRFTTQAMLSLESRMIERAQDLAAVDHHAVSASYQEKALSNRSLTLEQKEAFDHLLGFGDLSCVVGFAGTGKSYLLGAAREAYESAGYRVLGVTLSGIAAENLEGSSGILSRTYASRCFYWDKGEELLGPRDVLVVDEAGMLASRHMARLMEMAHSGGSKVILVGDPQQLQAIEAGAAFRAIAGQVSYVELSDIRRQVVDWQRESTLDFARGFTGDALARYEAHAQVHVLETQAGAKAQLVHCWNEGRLAHPTQSQIMLAYNRSDVLELNELARGLRRAGGELGDDSPFKTERGDRVFAVNDRVYFLKNDRSLGVMNGTLGTIESIEHGSMVVRLDTVRLDHNDRFHSSSIQINMDHYNHLDHGYAATIHKAQGVTVDRSYILASRYLDKHSTYVAMSRHRHSADLFYGKDVFLSKDDLLRTVGRDRSKDVSLDYLHDREQSLKLPEDKSLLLGTDLARGEVTLMKQKLDAFTRETLGSRGTERGGMDYHRRLAEAKRGMDAFKRDFENKHPELASTLRENMMPAHEKNAVVFIKEYEHLQKIIDQGGRSSHMAKSQLENLVDKISKQKEVMAYVHEHYPAIEKRVKELDRGLRLQRGRELEL